VSGLGDDTGARSPNAAGSLLVLAPLRIEARAVSAGAPGETVVRVGMGPRRAAAAAARVRPGVAGRHAAVAVAGVAGALVDGLDPGDLVVADRVLDESGAVVARLPSAALLGAELARRGLVVRIGAVVSTDHVVHGRAARADLARTGALAVDMESAALLAEPWGVPTAVVRAVSDRPGAELVSPAALRHGWRALRSLRAAAPVLRAWAGAAGPRRVVVASPRSFCAGVQRAVDTVVAALERASLERDGAPVYVRRQIVHNEHVVDDLRRRGAVFVRELDEVPTGSTVVFSAHGVSPAVRDEAERRELRVVDATCPLVAKVHTEVRRLATSGHQVVLIGHAGHDETEGTLGEVPGMHLVADPLDVDGLDLDDDAPVGYATQTTLAPEDVAPTVAALQRRFAELAGPSASDICYATHNRQEAVRAIAGDCDLVLVVGSPTSSNSLRLVEVAERTGGHAELVGDETDLRLDRLAHAECVGVTAGASVPEVLVERVIDALGGLGPIEVEHRTVRRETVSFSLPLEVR
jgi:4-hydroxy-3-methylbut-2-enyl diphosphate reductase